VSTVLVTGSSGMLGKHVSNFLEIRKTNLVRHNRKMCDLTKFDEVSAMFQKYKPSTVIHCAALVGGIKANRDSQGLFFTKNVQIDMNVLQNAQLFGVEKLLYIGSSCMYPSNVLRPLKIEDLNSGPLESTNLDYALAKLAGSQYVKSVALETGLPWRTFIASNLYGPFDNFERDKSHLIASIILKIVSNHKSGENELVIWGNGKPKREFTFVVDFANWIVEVMPHLNLLPPIMNVGIGIDYSVREYYEIALKVAGLKMNLVYEESLPNGTTRKLMDSSIARSHGWNPKTSIETGLSQTMDWFKKNVA